MHNVHSPEASRLGAEEASPTLRVNGGGKTSGEEVKNLQEHFWYNCSANTVTLFFPTSFLLREDNDVFVNVKINRLETHKKMQTTFNHIRLTAHLHIN